MFDISTVSKRYFEVKLTLTDDNDEEIKNIELKVEPPKIKMLKKLMAVWKASKADAMDELAEAIQKLLSKNKDGYKVPMEYIDELDYDQMNELLTEYFKWLGKEKNSKN